MKKEKTDIEKNNVEVSQNETSVTPAKKEKKKKEEKQIPAKKLPGILKKSYTRKKLAKLLNHIYIPTHKEMVESLFVPNPKKEGKFYIPREQLFPKSQFVKLKKIGKDVASQKFSIKIVPLAVTVGFCIAAVFAVITFKDQIARKLMINGMQNVFGAKTEIGYVHVEILGSSVHIKDLKQAYKDNPMRNLFEFKDIVIDFNLTELLRGKFDLQNIVAEGLDVMTGRETSGALPEKKKKKKTAAEKSPLELDIENRMNNMQVTAKEEVKKIFEQVNPDTLIPQLQAQLKSPEIAKEAYEKGTEIYDRWKDKPDEINKLIDEVSKKSEKYIGYDWSKVTNPVEMKNAITEMTALVNDCKKVKNQTSDLINDMNKDVKVVTDYSAKLKSAVDADYKFVDETIGKIKSLPWNDGLKLISGPIDNILYAGIGKYYPLLRQGIASAMEMKNSNNKDKKKEVKQEKYKRARGRMVYYRKDRVPQFLIENMSFSGVNFAGKANEISNDMDKRGTPATAELTIKDGSMNHRGGLLVDCRTVTDNPLIKADYTGERYPINFSFPDFGIKGPSDIVGNISVKNDGTLIIDGTLFMKEVAFSTTEFEPAYAYNLYARTLGFIKELKLGAKIEIDWNENLKLDIICDADKQLGSALYQLGMEELNNVKKQASDYVRNWLKNETGGAYDVINNVVDLNNIASKDALKADNLTKSVNKEIDKVTAQLKDQAAGEAKSGLEKMLGNKLF